MQQILSSSVKKNSLVNVGAPANRIPSSTSNPSFSATLAGMVGTASHCHLQGFGGDGDQALRIACVHGEALRSRGGKHAQKEKVVALGREKAELIKLLI